MPICWRILWPLPFGARRLNWEARSCGKSSRFHEKFQEVHAHWTLLVVFWGWFWYAFDSRLFMRVEEMLKIRRFNTVWCSTATNYHGTQKLMGFNGWKMMFNQTFSGSGHFHSAVRAWQRDNQRLVHEAIGFTWFHYVFTSDERRQLPRGNTS